MTSDRVRELARQLVTRADLLLQESLDPAQVDGRPGAPTRHRRLAALGVRGWLDRPAALLFLGVALVASVTASVLIVSGDLPAEEAGFASMLFRIVAVWALAFAPGWVFVLFLGERVPILWRQYVLDLHRLYGDRPQDLPRPPFGSSEFAAWRTVGGEAASARGWVFQEKFDWRYGASVSDSAVDRQSRVRAEALVPVFLLSGLLSVGWTVLLWWAPGEVLDATAFRTSLLLGFVGAYLYCVQAVVRGFVRSDLRAGTYVASVNRIVLTLVLVTAAHLLLSQLGVEEPGLAIVAFVVGVFPWPFLLALLRWLASVALRRLVPNMAQENPLSMLQGLTTWHEARLAEADIENLPNLASADLVDLMLNTGVPTSRLVDWVDQAMLLVLLDRSGSDAAGLARLGIRTGSDLLRIVTPREPDARPEPESRTDVLPALAKHGLDTSAMRHIVRALKGQEVTLRPILNWKLGLDEAKAILGPVASDTRAGPSSPDDTSEHRFTRSRPGTRDR